MKNASSVYFVFFIVFLVSCSSPSDPNENSITITKFDKQLIISNNWERTVYIIIVEQKIAALINWAPHFSDPRILTNSAIKISYSEIYNGKEEPVELGDKVIIYFWDDSDKENPRVFSKVMEL